jgi:uncharacterized protein with PIN domain
MLKGLAKWLRAAGYDTAIPADGAPDRCLIEQARNERRILLTRDRKLPELEAAGASVLLLDCNQLDDCIEELRGRLGIDWLHAPFTRCLRCNTPLVKADQDRWGEVPEFSREAASRLLYCPTCGQLFWDGSHVARMHERLARAASGSRS